MPWLTDRGRLFFEGAFESNSPLNSLKSNDIWLNIFFELKYMVYILDHFKAKTSLNFNSYLTIIFKNLDSENLFFLQQLEQKFSFIQSRLDRFVNQSLNIENNYLFDPVLETKKLKYSSLAVLLSANPRYEGYSFNLNLRQRYLKGNFQILTLGPKTDLTMHSTVFGASITGLISLSEGISVTCQEVESSVLPVFITNSNFFKIKGASVIQTLIYTINLGCKSLGGLSVISDRIETTGVLNMKTYKPFNKNDFNNSLGLYFMNTDFSNNSHFKNLLQSNLLSFKPPKFNILIEQGDSIKNLSFNSTYKTVKDKSFSYLPLKTKNVFEDNHFYVNTRGVSKKSVKILNSKNHLKSNFQILRSLYSFLETVFSISNKKDNLLISSKLSNKFNQSNYNKFMFSPVPTLTTVSFILDFQATPFFKDPFNFKKQFNCLNAYKMKYWLDDFFIGGSRDNYSPQSATLIKCSKSVRLGSTNFF